MFVELISILLVVRIRNYPEEKKNLQFPGFTPRPEQEVVASLSTVSTWMLQFGLPLHISPVGEGCGSPSVHQ